MGEDDKKTKDDENYGITWSTEYNLDITAAAENTLIMGESAELVAGASGTLEAGGSVDAFFLELLEITLGFRQILSNECKFNFSTEENEVTALRSKVDAHMTEIVTGIKLEALEAKLKMVTEKVKTVGDALTANDQEYKALVDKVGLCASKDEANGVKQQVATDVNRALAEQSNALGDQTLTVGQDTQTVAAKTQTLASHVKTALEQTKNIAAATHLGAEETTLSGIINKL
jgi:hypothetical protein